MFLALIYDCLYHFRGMKTLIAIILLGGVSFLAPPQPHPSGSADLSVVFWNLENFFDYFDDGTGGSDAEFSSSGARHWTKKRFTAKCMSVAKAIFAIADRTGKMPDVIGVAEVENAFVVRKMVELTPLRRHGYEVVHYDSPDPRGIDVAMIYRPSSLRLVSSCPCRIQDVITRDILLAQFVTPKGDSIAMMFNHHPSKYGGESSAMRRAAAVERMDEIADSLRREGWTKLISSGDFNDTPDSEIYRPLAGKWANLSAEPARHGKGSIRFDGRWQLIDQCFVSRELAGGSRMEVCDLPCLTVRDAAHSGQKPFRTYSGPRYIGGVSDHYPIVVIIDGFL